jgi:peroxiredoxin/outer membrane lipoprotein-sorting protein
MKARILYAALLVLFCFSGCQGPRQPEKILLKTTRQISQLDKINYQATVTTSDFGSADSQKVETTLWAQKWAEDPLLGYRIRMKKNGASYIYNPPHLYRVDHQKDNILKINTSHNANALAEFSMERLLFNELLFEDFYRQVQTPGYQKTLEKETSDHWIIRIDYPPEKEISHMSRTLWIRKSNHLPDRMAYRVAYREETYYQRTELQHLSTNAGFSQEIFSASDMLERYPIRNHLSNNSSNINLSIGEMVPEFEHPTLEGGLTSRRSLRGKVAVLVFWYKGCAACSAALTRLDVLQSRYVDQGFTVVGINSIDRERSPLEEWKDKHAISFPILLGDEYTENLYRIRVYPTFYLVDRQGILRHMHHGASDDSMRELTEEIRNLLSGEKEP